MPQVVEVEIRKFGSAARLGGVTVQPLKGRGVDSGTDCSRDFSERSPLSPSGIQLFHSRKHTGMDPLDLIV